jgi:hypothetical protein
MAKSPTKAARRKAPAKNATWTKFLSAHPQVFTAVFGTKIALPPRVTLNRLVQSSVKTLVAGRSATLSAKQGNAAVVFVALADKADFDKLKAHHKGKPWTSTVPGSVDGFQVYLP